MTKYLKHLNTNQIRRPNYYTSFDRFFCSVCILFVSIINHSFRTGEIPASWKVSTLVPFTKVKNTSDASNFRPVNVLPISEKLMECAMKQQLLAYIENNNILTKHQSGFRQNHSCETSLNLVLTSRKNNLDKGKYIIAVFLDLNV